MKLELGCGLKPTPGYLHHDRWLHSQHVDIAWDLNVMPWPWPDDAFKEVLAEDILEHLNDFFLFFDECHRILAPGGRIKVRVPRWDSPNVYLDPTHKRGYHIHNFGYLDPDTSHGAGKGRLYTAHPWRIISLEDGGNITGVLEVRK